MSSSAKGSYYRYLYTHDSTERHVGDNDMPEALSGRHGIVLGLPFFVCDGSLYTQQRASFLLFARSTARRRELPLLYWRFDVAVHPSCYYECKSLLPDWEV